MFAPLPEDMYGSSSLYDEATGPIEPPKTNAGKRRGRPKKDETANGESLRSEHAPKPAVLPRADRTPLTDAQARDMRERLHDALEWAFNTTDDVLQAITAGHDEVDIWSTMPDDEIWRITDLWLMRAKKKPAVAARVRGTISLYETWVIPVSIYMPRMIATAKLINERGISVKD